MKKFIPDVIKFQFKNGRGYLCCQHKKAILLSVLILKLVLPVTGQTTVRYTTPGTTSWVCPPGVTSVVVQCWGGGGAGGSAKGTLFSNSAYGGGGAGGASVIKTIAVVPGNSYTVTVASGVTSSATNGASVQGNPSWFGSVSTVYAEGGAGGVSKTGGSGTGSGGTASVAASVGTVLYKGGSGVAGNSSAPGYGGGGASSAGSTGNGNGGTTLLGGLAPFGGAAGGAGTLSGNGNNGAAPGGGGGGAASLLVSTVRTGGAGGAGQVIITYAACPGAPLISPSSATICSGDVQALAVGAAYNTNKSGATGAGVLSSASSPAPLSTLLSTGQWTQCLVTAAQLAAMGYIAGSQITSVSLNVQAPNANAALKNLTISMGSTTLTALTSTFVSNLSQLYTSSSYTVTAGVNSWTLTTPFNWDGSSNVIVEFIFDGTSLSASGAATYYTTTAANTVTYYSDVTGANSITSVKSTGYVLGTTSTQLPNISFAGSNPATTWLPITYLYTNAGATTAYTIGTASSVVYAKPPSTTAYTVAASNSSCSINSAAATINVNPLTTISTQPIAANYCQGATATNLSVGASGTGTLTYQWFSNTINSNSGGVLIGTSSSILPSTSSAGTLFYYVTVTGSCGSITSSTAAVNITATPSASIAYSGSPYCASGIATVTQTGTAGGAYSSTAGLSIDPLSGDIDLNASSAGTYTVTYTVAAYGGCNVYAATTSITVSTGTWLGVTTDWNNAANWCGGVPTSSTNVIIPTVGSNIYPSASTAVAMAKNITIAPTASVTVSDYTLQIAGSISNAGTFDASAGTVEFIGTVAQTIPINTFYNHSIKNLIISNSSVAGVTLNDLLDVYTSITYGTVGTVFNTNGKLTLKSTATETAWIGDMTGHVINGDVTVERFIQAKRAWRLLTGPVAGSTSTQSINATWQEGKYNVVPLSPQYTVPGLGTEITDKIATIPATTGFDQAVTNSPSILYLDPTGSSWISPASTKTVHVNDQEGFMLFVRGDRTIPITTAPFAAPNSTVLRTKGSLNQGTKTVAITHAGPVNGYNVIGNPFAARISFNALYNVNSSLSADNYVLWDPMLTGSNQVGGYVYFTSTATPGIYAQTTSASVYDNRGHIESGSAFFVNFSNTGTFTIPESSKDTGSNLVFRPAAANYQGIRTDLYSTDEFEQRHFEDGTLVLYDSAYSNEVNWMEDSKKLSNQQAGLSIKSNGLSLAIEKKKPVKVTDTVFLNISKLKVQTNYQFQIAPTQLEQSGLTAVLEDTYNGITTALSVSDITNVKFVVTTDSLSQGDRRYRIVFKPLDGPLPVTFTSIKAWQLNRSIAVKWDVADEINISRYEVQHSGDGMHFISAATIAAANNRNNPAYNWVDEHPIVNDYNYYRIRSIDNAGLSNYSATAKVKLTNKGAYIVVYPNPVVNGIVNVEMHDMPTGNYEAKLINNLGQVIINSKFAHTQQTNIKEIANIKAAAKGIYLLEIICPDHTVINSKLIVE